MAREALAWRWCMVLVPSGINMLKSSGDPVQRRLGQGKLRWRFRGLFCFGHFLVICWPFYDMFLHVYIVLCFAFWGDLFLPSALLKFLKDLLRLFGSWASYAHPSYPRSRMKATNVYKNSSRTLEAGLSSGVIFVPPSDLLQGLLVVFFMFPSVGTSKRLLGMAYRKVARRGTQLGCCVPCAAFAFCEAPNFKILLGFFGLKYQQHKCVGISCYPILKGFASWLSFCSTKINLHL